LTFGFFVAFTPQPEIENKLKRVVIDAGHGGKDPGNLGTGRFKTTEKDVTLDVALQLGKYISDAFPDVQVIYTRDDDSYPTLQDRVSIANSNSADLFISIHCDAFTKASASGSGSFVMGMHKSDEALRVSMKENASMFMEEDYENKYGFFDPKDPDTFIALNMRQDIYLDQSLSLSKKIQDQFRERVGRKDRGVKQAGYYVICFTTMPSVLVELGFLTNAKEEEFLNSEKGKSYMSSALFRAFREYKNEVEGVKTSIVTPEPPAIELPEEKIEEELVEVNSNWKESIVHERIKKGVKFQVQILTSSKKIERSSADFKGLKKVDEYISNGLFKYSAGCTTDYKKAQEMQHVLRSNGFPGAFIIAFKDGERIQLHEALN
ncbi:MAG: N-acetylmuramoyl-L-alanine amidase family protein, partial [Flavobacteriales bacterium]